MASKTVCTSELIVALWKYYESKIVKCRLHFLLEHEHIHGAIDLNAKAVLQIKQKILRHDPPQLAYNHTTSR